MSRLAELQQAFQQQLLDPAADVAPRWVSPGGRASPARQLAAYVHAYAARLGETLAGDYPALLLAVGEARFGQLAQEYIAAHPSRSFTLREFGAGLADFIAAAESYRDLPWLAELAHFEWSLGRSFDAPDTPLATFDDLAAVPATDWPALRFHLHPSVQRLPFRWNAPGLWSALTADEPQPVSAQAGEPVPWLIWRERLVTRFRSLEAEEATLLACVAQGASFATLCETLTRYHDPSEVPLRAASWLKGWLGHGLIRKDDRNRAPV